MAKAVLTNAWLYTARRTFERGSLVTSGDRIESVMPGENAPVVPEGAAVIDLDGGYLLPGFVDTHIHLTSIALKTLRCDLSGARSARHVSELLADWAATRVEAVMGVEWDEDSWADRAFPTRVMLDEIDSKRPILARRICGHLGVANSALLDRLTPRPEFIDTETGVIREHALWEAGRLCEPDLEGLVGAMEGAIRSLHRLGITGIHDIVEPAKFEFYLRGVASSSAPLRIDALLHTKPEHLAEYLAMSEGVSDYLRVAGVKCFLDGSLGGRTAALNAPYQGGGDNRGTLLMAPDELRSIVRASHEGGHMCAMHAIGDRAIDQALDAIEPFPPNTANFRIEHCEIVGSGQLERLRTSPVFLAVQPNFIRNWGTRGSVYEKCLGRERLRSCNPLRTLMNSGVPYVFGSDGMPPGPLYGLRGATEHPVPDERLSPQDAIACYTERPNRIGLHRREAGALQPGGLADMVVLDGNPLGSDLDGLQVTRTILGGQVVFGPGANHGVARTPN